MRPGPPPALRVEQTLYGFAQPLAGARILLSDSGLLAEALMPAAVLGAFCALFATVSNDTPGWLGWLGAFYKIFALLAPLPPPATLALIDGNRCPVLSIRAEAIIKGDDKVPAISAASILAKTARDAALSLLHVQYPQYAFDQHKGYPTALHLERLRAHGVSPVHRQSYAPVRALINAKTP